MNLNKEAHLFAHFRVYSWLLAGVWTGCVAGSLAWNLREQADHSLQMARRTAQVTFENDVLYRRWSANQGGVYVRVSRDTPPNPYLAVPDRDVTTTSGLSLTLVNPAYMARQVNALAGADRGNQGHLTSLKPIRPENAPDAWEAAALRSFEQGVQEVSSVQKMADGEYLRLIRPFVAEKSCLKCHAAQGYNEGDIRGGISVSVPMGPLRALREPMSAHLALAHVGLWAVGLAGIGLFRRSLGKEILGRERAEEDLRRLAADLEQRVAAQTAEIRRANETLEQRVAGRTADIEAANRQLHEREDELRLIMDATPALLSYVDADYRYRRANRGYERWFGHPAEAVQGRHLRDVVGEAAWQAIRPQAQRALAGEVVTYETEMPYREGGVRWVHVTYTPDRDAAGRVQGFVAHVMDVGEHRRAEAALRQSREDLDRAQQVGQIGSWRLDVQHNVLTWSDENHRIFGVPKGTALTYEAFLEIVHPDDRQCVDAQWQAGLRGEPYDVEHRIVADGQVKWVREKAYLEFDDDHKLLGGFGITQDITERKQAEEALRRTVEELARSNKELEQFAFIASHDLQEPLRMVNAFLRLLEERYQPQLDDKAREYIGYSVEGATRMSQLIADLFAYSRVGREDTGLEPVDVNRPLAIALDNLRGSIQEAGATVTHDELPSIAGDVTQLTQLFQNLIGNAVKFRHPDRPCHVHLSARREDGRWVFAVRDNGIGIPKEAVDRVFAIFQRLHTRAKYPGTGIGLAICKKIVEQRGGRIWVESTVGEGSTFYVTL